MVKNVRNSDWWDQTNCFVGDSVEDYKYSRPSKYQKVLNGECSLTKTFVLSSHVLVWKVHNMPRNYCFALNYPQNRQRFFKIFFCEAKQLSQASEQSNYPVVQCACCR